MTDPDVDDFGYDPTLDIASKATPIRAAAAPPPGSVLVPPQFLPPVGKQGTKASPGAPGTCTAWAGVYGLTTYYVARKNNTPPTTPDLQASPAYIYVKVREQGGAAKPPCLGTSYAPYFAMLQQQGTFSMAEAPYTNKCTTLWSAYGSHSAPPNGNVFVLPTPPSRVSTSDVTGMKTLLSRGCPIAYGTALFTDWSAYRGTPVVYVGNFIPAQGKNGPARHCMLIIGYNDELGAWRIQNSQGTVWGKGGQLWMDYATFAVLAEPVDGFYFD